MASKTRPISGVVAIGASAGGLAPLRAFFRSVPVDTGASFVVVQHLSPTEPSLTPDLLGSDTVMPRRQIEDGMAFQPDEIYFLPPDASLWVEDGLLHLRKGEQREPTRSVIDVFLTSLAEELGPATIGILLSGTGSDGTRGMRAVKEHGGLTMAQDPRTAEFDGMPSSAIRAGSVDFQGPIAELAAKVADVLAGRGKATAVGGDEVGDEPVPGKALARIAEVLRRSAGHDFSDYKQGTLTRRIHRRLQLRGNLDVDAYVRALTEDPAEAEALVRDLMIGVTEFFRDPEKWETLERKVIPDLLDSSTESDPLRAWVVGCATGEEAYSLAISLHEGAAKLEHPGEFTIFATDINEVGLEFAREGLYPTGIATQMDPARLERWFTLDSEHYRVAKKLRESIVFALHNVLRDPPFSRQSLITCRNLLIYLEPRAQEQVLRVLAYALEPGGYLFLGSSETLTSHGDLFDEMDGDRRIFRRNSISGPLPVAPLKGVPAVRRRAARPAPEQVTTKRPSQPRDVRRTLERTLLDRYGPAAALINAHNEVIELFGPTRRYLEPSAARGENRLLDMALPGLRGKLQTAIREARETGGAVTRSNVKVPTPGRTEALDLTVRPAPQLDAGEGLLLVILQERMEASGADEPAHPGAVEDFFASPTDVEEELRETRMRLQAAVEELESANEELQSTNEELLSVNEELQTSTEEALSINEELNTVNSELKTKVVELDRAHGDLFNLFRSTGIPTVFLDKERRIRRFTPTAERLFHIRGSDTGRPLEEINQRFADGQLRELIDGVLESLEVAETEVFVEDDDAWYTLRIAPYRTIDDVIEGVVLTFTDVTRIKETEHRLRNEREYAERIVETVRDPLVVLDHDLRIRTANQSFCDAFGVTEEEVRTRRLMELEGIAGVAGELVPRLTGILPEGEAGDSFELGVEMELPGTGRRILQINAQAVRSVAEAPGRILLTAHDVTDHYERERARDEEARHKNWFLAMLGHELRNPLVPIRNSLGILQEEELSPADREHLIDVALRQVAHLTRLVEDLLDISRITQGKLTFQSEPLDFALLVRETVDDHRPHLEESGIDFQLDSAEDGLWMVGDPHRLAQAVGNLLDNARKYTPAGGVVRVRVGPASEQESELVIEDTGMGIAQELLEHVFDPFRQGEPSPESVESGLGIGLALVRSIAEGHEGSVRVESAGPGEGTRFVMRLPRRSLDRTGPGGTVRSRRAPSSSPRRILIVEDHAVAAETTGFVLERAGHTVEIVADGASALERIEELRPQVILCDLGLPGGMSGYDVARAVRAAPGGDEIRLVALTGYGQEEDRREAYAAGFDVFLSKPVSPEELRWEVIAAEETPDEPG